MTQSLFEQQHPLILASASPRRRELLEQVGVRFQVAPAAIDETPRANEDARSLVERLAAGKACAGEHSEWVLGADTTVTIDNLILGTPRDGREASEMLARLQGRPHEVISAFTLAHRGRAEITESYSSKVWMGPLSSAEIQAYVATGEPLDKAGAYAVQGYGIQFVQRIEGSYTNIVGLNVSACVAALIRVEVLRSL